MVIPTLQVGAGNADLGQREARMMRQECPYKEAWAGCPVEPEGAPRNVEGLEDPGVKNIIGICERRRGAWLEGQGPDRVWAPASPYPSSALQSWAALPGTSLAPSHTQRPDHLTGMSRPRVLHLCCT